MKTLMERWQEVFKTAQPVIDEDGQEAQGFDGQLWQDFKASITPADFVALATKVAPEPTEKVKIEPWFQNEFNVISTRSLASGGVIEYTVWDINTEFVILVHEDEVKQFTRNFNYIGLYTWMRGIIQSYRDGDMPLDEIQYDWDDNGVTVQTCITLRRGYPHD